MTTRLASASLARAGITVAGAFLLSRILGYVRVAIITAQFGIGADLDAFYAAFRLPDLVFQIVAAGALSSALVPVLTGLLASGSSARAARVLSGVAAWLLGALLVLTLLAELAAPALVSIMAPGFEGAQLEQTVGLTRVMLLAPLLLAAGSLATSGLNAQHRFAATAMAPIAYNLGIITGALLLAPSLGVDGLAWSVVAGAVLFLVVQLPSLRRIGLSLRPTLEHDPEVGHTARLMAPRALGLGAAQIVFVVLTALASTLPTGSVTALNLAQVLLQIPLGVIGVPLGIVLLPALSREASLGDLARFRALLVRALRILLVVMLAIGCVALAIAPAIVGLLFPSLRAESEVGPTAGAFAVLLVGLPAHALIAVLARAFYAQQDTRTPVILAIASATLNIVVAVALAPVLGLPGLTSAIAIGAWVEAGALYALLERRTGGLGPRSMAHLALLLAPGTLLGYAAARVVAGGLGPGADDLLRLALATGVAAAAGGGAYLAAGLLLRVPELSYLLSLPRQLWRDARQRA